MEQSGPKPVTWNEIIRRSREAAGVTQDELRAVAGIAKGTYSRFENGEAELSVPVLMQLCAFLDPKPVKFLPVTQSGALVYYDMTDLIRFPQVPQGGKLTEHIAKQLEARQEKEWAAHVEREEPARKLELRAKGANFEALTEGRKARRRAQGGLLGRYRELEAKNKTLREAFEGLAEEVAGLKAQLAKRTPQPANCRKRSRVKGEKQA
jgi:transcriptional regulator with XRE-family HTH domain